MSAGGRKRRFDASLQIKLGPYPQMKKLGTVAIGAAGLTNSNT